MAKVKKIRPDTLECPSDAVGANLSASTPKEAPEPTLAEVKAANARLAELLRGVAANLDALRLAILKVVG